jgi:hypothetical protein
MFRAFGEERRTPSGTASPPATPPPRFRRADHFVVAARRGDVQVRELRLVLGHQRRPFGIGSDACAMRSRNTMFTAPSTPADRNLRRGPYKFRSPRMCLLLATSYALICLAGDDPSPWEPSPRRTHTGLRAAANDAAMFLVDTGREPGHVHGRQRNVGSVAVRRIALPCPMRRCRTPGDVGLLGDNTNRATLDPREPADDIARKPA